jgi:hypothetical protein
VGSIGTPLTLPSIQVQNTYSFSDNVIQTRGKHSLRSHCLPGTVFNTCAFLDSRLGSFGNTRDNTVLGPKVRLWDLSLLKNFTLPKEIKLQFRTEFFNPLNLTNFVLNQTGTDLPSPTFGFPDGRATSAHHAVTWVWGGCVQPSRARSLPLPLGCGSCRSGC